MQYPQAGGIVLVRHALPRYSKAELATVTDMPVGAAALVPELGILTYDPTQVGDVPSTAEPGGWAARVQVSDGEDASLLAIVEDLEEQVEAQGFALEALGLDIKALESERTKPRRLSIASTSVGAGASVAFDLAWPGVQVGDATHATPFATLPAALAVRAFCPAAEVVRVQLYNPTGGSISMGAGDFTIAVIGRA